MYHILSIHSSVDGHLNYFHVLALVNSAAMNTRAHVTFLITVFAEYISSTGIDGLHGSFIFYFLRDLHAVFHAARRGTVHGAARIRHDLVTKQQQIIRTRWSANNDEDLP